jgi:inorganic pyrophosphatase
VATVDDRGKDDKIISVAADDPGYDQVHTVTDLPPHRFREMEQFLKGYKALQDTVLEVGAPQGVRKARMAIRDALRLYDVQLRPGLQGRHKGWLLNHKPK